MSEQYEVGYGKPPKHTRFKAGQSGNPNGRKKGTKDTRILLNDALSEKVTLKENGKTFTCSKRQAIIMRLINQALLGDMRAIKLILDCLYHQDLEQETRQAIENYSSDVDKNILNNFLKDYGVDVDGKQ